jgi:hypothetical protein
VDIKKGTTPMLAPIAKVNKIFSLNYKDQVFDVMYRTGKLIDGGERKFTKITLNRMPFPSIYKDGHLDEKEITLVCEEFK